MQAHRADPQPKRIAFAPMPMACNLRRRAFLAATAAIGLQAAVRAAAPPLRLGVLQFGSVQWLTETMRRHALDAANGFDLVPVTLANTDAGRVALMAGAADIIVSDWFFVAAQRAAGTKLRFAPFSSASGGIMVPRSSPIRSLPDLAGRRLGVAGGPLDKSWLVVRAAARSDAGIDLASVARLSYGAPPLLNAMLQRGELDAVLTYWNFAARLDGTGFRQAVSVGDCARGLGLSDRLSLIGFVFHEDWAKRNPAAIEGFLAAAAGAESLMATDAAEWQAIRPLMDAPDDALFDSLRRRFVAGIPQATTQTQQRDAERLFEIVRRTGGERGVDGLDALPDGVFWPIHDG
jgi:NitT/TauT family transport system substrate-binding protein